MFAFNSWLFFAGLALFIYGVRTLDESLRALAGRPFKKFIQRQTAHPFKAILSGALATAILQGSSVVLLITLSFVGAGILTMQNALALVLGSNLGTTFDSWIIAWLGFRFNIEAWSYPLLSLSLLGLLFFGNNRSIGWWTRLLLAFSLLFIGLAYMKSALATDHATFVLIEYAGDSPYWFIPYGFLLTVLIQSSFATMAIALSALHAHQLTIEQAAALAVGAELGTSIKLLLSSSKGGADKKRVAWGNFYFNLFSMLVGSLLLFPMIHYLHDRIFPDDPLLSVVSFVSLLNLIVLLLCFPFLSRMSRWLESHIQGSNGLGNQHVYTSSHLTMSDSSLLLIKKETIDLAKLSVQINRNALGIKIRAVPDKSKLWIWLRNWYAEGVPFMDEYKLLKLRQGEQLEHCAELLRDDLAPKETEQLNKLIHALRNITHSSKNIKNIRGNLKELSDSANDYLFNELKVIQERERVFYTMLSAALCKSEPFLDSVKEKLMDNRREHDKAIQHIMLLLQRRCVAEAEASTLLNVYRELYSSRKALLEVMQDLQSQE